MAPLKKRVHAFDIHVQDMTLRVTASPDLYEECRASAMQFWDQLHSFALRNQRFGTSKLPVELADGAPPLMVEIARMTALAGVGPMCAFEGAVTDYVGRFLASQSGEAVISNGGGYFAVTRKRTKLTVLHREEKKDGLAIVVDPKFGQLGVYTTMGRSDLPVGNVGSLVVLANSCTLADAVGVYALGLMAQPDPLKKTLAYLRSVQGVHGGIVIRGGDIGVAGTVEIAA
jgi:hypothetical protein